MAFYHGCIVEGKMSDSSSNLSKISDTDADFPKFWTPTHINVNEVWLSTNL